MVIIVLILTMKLNFTFAVVLSVVLYQVNALSGRGKGTDTRNALERIDAERNTTRKPLRANRSSSTSADTERSDQRVRRDKAPRTDRDRNRFRYRHIRLTLPSSLRRDNIVTAQRCWNVGKAAEYNGPVSTTIDGQTCIAWDTRGLGTSVDPSQFPERNKTSAQNFCRDPTGQGMPWCYTNQKSCFNFHNTRICHYSWHYCIAPLCSGHKQFCIKHKFSGKILSAILEIESNPDREECDFIFIKAKDGGIWGYIQNVLSGYYVVPDSESITPANGEDLWLREMTPHAANEFAFDQVRNVWVHRSGKYVTQESNNHIPPDGCDLELRDEYRVDAQWELVNPSNLTVPLLIYDKPNITGHWETIFTRLTPKAEHIWKYKVSVGQTVTTSSTFQNEFTLQLTVSGAISTYSVSMSTTTRVMYEHARSETWTKNTVTERTIKVTPGPTVVVWQYVFEVAQEDQKSVFRSNILADTDSPFKKPPFSDFTSEHIYTI